MKAIAKTTHPKMVSHFLKLNVVMYGELSLDIILTAKKLFFCQ